MPEHYNAGDRMPEGVLLLDSATVLALAGALGMSSAQLDALFISAAQIEA